MKFSRLGKTLCGVTRSPSVPLMRKHLRTFTSVSVVSGVTLKLAPKGSTEPNW